MPQRDTAQDCQVWQGWWMGSFATLRLREETSERSAAKQVARCFEAMLDNLNDLEIQFSNVIEVHVQCKTPKRAQGPYRNGVYDPVLDDGVAVNILRL